MSDGTHTSINDNLKLYVLNVCGFLRCKDELENWVCSIRPDILCLTETHVTSDISDHEIYIKNYNASRTDSNTHRTGGVLIYVRDSIKFKRKYIAAVEGTWIELIKININNGITICNLYRSPSSLVSKFCIDIAKVAEDLNDGNELLIVGDFNIDVSKNSNYGKKLLKDLKLLGLTQKVRLPTRCTTTSNTIIDLIFSNFCVETEVLDTPKLSDHNIIFCKIPILNRTITKKKDKN